MVLFFLINIVRAYSQCTLSVNLTATNNVICSGNAVNLIAKPSAGTPGYTYAWSTGETTSTITVNKAGTYTVSVKDNTPGCQPVVKNIVIADGVAPPAPTVTDEFACLNSPASITASGSTGTYQWYDAPTGGNFLASGATYNTPVITGKKTFYVETTVNGCPSTRSAVTVTPYAVFATGGTTCPGSSVVLAAGGAGSYIWYDAPGGNKVGDGNTFTTPPLNTTTKYYVVGTTQGCVSPPVEVTATVFAAPNPPVAAGLVICNGSVATLHATANSTDVFDWFTTPTGGTSLISSPDYTTPPLTANTTYYVQITTTRGCVSTRTPVTVTVNPIPAIPTAPDVSTCLGSKATLTASAPGTNFNWYATQNSTRVLGNGSTYLTPVLNASADFYVAAVNGACEGPRKVVHVTVNKIPAAPTVPGQTICSGSTALLNAIAPGGDYNWYSGPAGGPPLFTGNPFITPALTANKTYYVEAVVAGCIGPRTAVVVTVNPIPAAPAAADATICAGSRATLVATGTGTLFEWYDVASGGTPIKSTATFVTPALTATTTYYVQTIDEGCISPRKAVLVTVNATPAAPTAADQTVCAGNQAHLLATGTGTSTVEWFTTATSVTPVHTGANYDPRVAATITYYVQASNGTCTSPRTPVTVTVTSSTNQFNYASSTYCTSSTALVTPTINVAGGVFSAAPAGLNITAAGEIDPANSAVGHYTVTYANGCAISTQRISIVVTPDASFSYSAATFCQTDVNPSPVFTATSSAGVFSATPAGLVFIGAGGIDLTTSRPDTYTITNTISAVGCSSVPATFTITIKKSVSVSAGANQTVITGTPVQLAGVISGGITTGSWSGGTGRFSNATNPRSIYTPGAGETSAVLTLTSDDPGAPCGPQSKSVTITFNPKPPAPVVAPVGICSGNAAGLSVNRGLAGSTYQWFTTPVVGGPSVGTGTNFITPILTATTVYYVQRTVAGVASDRTPVTVTVTPVPVAPSVAPIGPVCYGTQATLTATGSGGTYEWYDQPTAGNKVYTGPVFTTQFLTVNTTYYVQESSASCVSPTRTRVDVVVTPLPSVTSTNTGIVCSGSALAYNITADLPGTTFTFSRAAVGGISNAAVTNQPATTIAETLINTTGSDINVTYVITPSLNGCDGVPFKYVVTVNPTPVVTSEIADAGCSGTSVDYTIKFNTTNTVVSWSRAAVAGISNAPVTNQLSTRILETLVNTTNAPVKVDYNISYGTVGCTPSTFKYTITVNPTVLISSARTGTACWNVPQNYVITSQVPSATYSWSRAAVPGISNPAVTKASSVIDEALLNTSTLPITVVYTITTTANGCLTAPFRYAVVAYPQVPTPVANSNSPVCTANTIKLLTPTIVAGGTYKWTGPNGFTSSLQNPTIPNATAANQGTYTLYLLANGCTSLAKTVDVLVDALPVVNAGPDVTACVTAASVQLAGTVSGGTTTGLWTTSGTGTFLPSTAKLDGQYQPSAADVAAGSVTLTLASASKDDCHIVTDEMKITFTQVPGADAGVNQSICSQSTTIALNGKMLAPYSGTWTSNGSGTFTPSAVQNGSVSPTYIMSADDKKRSSIKFTLTSNTIDPCYLPSDDMRATLVPPPTVDAGPDRFLLKGNTIKLTPTVSDATATYQWSPATGLDDVTSKSPTVTGDVDMTYVLTVTDKRGCVATDTVNVKVAPKIVIANTFTPNNDGVNDFWDIPGLVAYTGATVDVFDRSGQKIFHSVGYGVPWDGTYNGKPLPFGTYYYIVDTKFLKPVFSGYVTIVK